MTWNQQKQLWPTTTRFCTPPVPAFFETCAPIVSFLSSVLQTFLFTRPCLCKNLDTARELSKARGNLLSLRRLILALAGSNGGSFVCKLGLQFLLAICWEGVLDGTKGDVLFKVRPTKIIEEEVRLDAGYAQTLRRVVLQEGLNQIFCWTSALRWKYQLRHSALAPTQRNHIRARSDLAEYLVTWTCEESLTTQQLKQQAAISPQVNSSIVTGLPDEHFWRHVFCRSNERVCATILGNVFAKPKVAKLTNAAIVGKQVFWF